MNNFYCAAPWRGLHINPQGNIKTCCAGNPHMLGNLNTQTIQQVLQGEKLQQIRAAIKQGIAHDYCSNCVNAEKFGNSEREWHNNINPDFDPTTASLTEYIPTLIDIRWNTTCNLSCNYCDPQASSKWATLKNIPFKSGTRPYSEQVCDYLSQYKEHIREVALVGGEPLLLPENERLLDVIPDDCVLTIITNMSVNLENNKIFKKASARKKVGWSMSFDNIGPQFEYVRYGADWNLLQTNLQIFKQLFAQGQWGGIHAVYNIYNATCLSEFVAWAKQQQVTIHFQTLHTPSYLNVSNHNQAVRDLALGEVDAVLSRTDLTDGERVFLTQVQQSLQQPATQNCSKEFVEYTNKLETQYHPDQNGQFAKLWPELVQALST